MKRESFLVYTSFYRPIKDALTDEQLGKLFRALFEYNLGDGDAAGDPVDADIAMAYGFFVNQFEIDAAKYDRIVEKRSEAGRAGRSKQMQAKRANADFAGQNGQMLANADFVGQNGQMPDLLGKTGYNVNDNVNDNVNENENKNENENDNVVVVVDNNAHTREDQPTPPPTTSDFLEILFFRNLRDAGAECVRFEAFYEGNGWTLKGGDVIPPEQRLAKARGWNPEDARPRFSAAFLDAWRRLYDALPAGVRPFALSDDTSERYAGGKLRVTCDARVLGWLNSPEGTQQGRAIFAPLCERCNVVFQVPKNQQQTR